MIRTPLRSDQGYIAATWARSMLSTHAHQRHFRSRNGLQIGKQIDQVLDRPDTRGLLMVRDSDPNYIQAWLLYCDGPATPTVFYVYTRRDDRGVGHAGALLERIGVDRHHAVVCTSLGPSSESLRGRFKLSVYLPLDEFLR